MGVLSKRAKPQAVTRARRVRNSEQTALHDRSYIVADGEAAPGDGARNKVRRCHAVCWLAESSRHPLQLTCEHATGN